MKLAVVHDLAEALAGDIAPFQNVSKEEKRRLEEEGLAQICATIGSNAICKLAVVVLRTVAPASLLPTAYLAYRLALGLPISAAVS